MTRICAVIPAAGRGSRLGLDCPKILAPLGEHRRIWDVLRDKLIGITDRIHVILAPSAMTLFAQALASDPQKERITLSQQATPLGMGDAIFGAEPFWSAFDSVVIVWGDQVNLSSDTLQRVAWLCKPDKTVVLPLVECQWPYVQYDVSDGVLRGVRQSREGDAVDQVGLSDVGVFALSVADLAGNWHRFEEDCAPGARTGELNFLPFLPFLSQRCKWDLHTVTVRDALEARGVNTPEDLQFARDRMAHLP